MWHVLHLVRAFATADGATTPKVVPKVVPKAVPKVVFHIFSQKPPLSSWTGRAKVNPNPNPHPHPHPHPHPSPSPPPSSSPSPQVPLEHQQAAEYVDELGCAASLRAQLAHLPMTYP